MRAISGRQVLPAAPSHLSPPETGFEMVQAVGDSTAQNRGDVAGMLHRMRLRSQYIRSMIDSTLEDNADVIHQAVLVMHDWIREQAEIRIAGYGRARLAIGIPGNRIAHAGGRVSTLGDITPLASTSRGGGLIVASSSGTTPHVLELMSTCRARAPRITILGSAVAGAKQFGALCDVFVGVSTPAVRRQPSLLFFNDAVEYAISEVMDAIVAAAVERAGVTERDLRHGHEDLGGTGPYIVPLESPR
jgi:D-arabinose 5-phosphate isomerase GutQ